MVVTTDMGYMEGLNGVNALVTGGSGFIGSHLVERLVGNGASVHIIATQCDANIRHDMGKATVHKIDVCDRKAVMDIVNKIKPKKVYHLAASLNRSRDMGVLDSLMRVNFQGTINVLDATKDVGIDSFVFISTSDVYGNNKSPFREDQPTDPISPYSLSKAAAEMACRMYYRIFGVPVTIIRSFLAYGPRQSPNMLIPEVITAALQKKDFKMTGGEQQRDVVFVTDLVDALIKASATDAATGEIINIGSGNKYKIVDVVKIILGIMGNPIKPQIGSLPYRANEIWEMFCDNSKAKRLLGWEPKTSLENGLEKTVKWYKDNHRC